MLWEVGVHARMCAGVWVWPSSMGRGRNSDQTTDRWEAMGVQASIGLV